MTDPRAALAEALVRWNHEGGDLLALLAERGVLLVTADFMDAADALSEALLATRDGYRADAEPVRRFRMALRAALSGEVTE
jgi:hypothetical protein